MITFEINGTQVFPTGEWDIVTERWEEEIFYRKRLTGDLTFRGADYDLIIAYSGCTEITMNIMCGEETVLDVIYKYPVSFRFDHDQCNVVATPYDTDDEYKCIIDDLDKVFTYSDFTTAGACSVTTKYRGRTAPWTLFGTFANSLTPVCMLADLLNNCGYTTATIKSSFFWGDNYPDGTSPGVNNYITSATNEFDQTNNYGLFFLPKATVINALKGSAVTGDDSITLRDILECFRFIFNVYWYIDSNGEFRLEHWYFFHEDFGIFGTQGEDLTTVLANGRSYAYRKDKYTYDFQKMPEYEVFQFSEGYPKGSGAFNGMLQLNTNLGFYHWIQNDPDCCEGTVSYNMPRIWVDIEYLRASSGYSNDGWQLMHCQFHNPTGTGNEWLIEWKARMFPAGSFTANGYLSWEYLWDNWQRYNRPTEDGFFPTDVGAVAQTFVPFKTKKQIPIEFKNCCTNVINPLEYMLTTMGLGKVSSLKENNVRTEVELLYEQDD